MRRVLLLPAALVAVGLLVVVVPVDAGAQASSATVQATNHQYSPESVTIAVGGSVTWTAPPSSLTTRNDPHPTRCDNRNDRGRTQGECPWGRFDLDPGQSKEVTFPESGTFHYSCTLHPKMLGTVIVGDGSPPSNEPSPTPSPSPSPSPSPTPSPTPAPTASPSPSPTTPADPDPEPTSEPDATEAPTEPAVQDDEDDGAPADPDPTDEPIDVTATEPTEPRVAIEARSELSDLGTFAAQVLAVLLLLATMGAQVAVRTILRD